MYSLPPFQLLWRGEVENQLDKCNPLLCVVIYDSCRDAASATMEAAMKLSVRLSKRLLTLSVVSMWRTRCFMYKPWGKFER